MAADRGAADREPDADHTRDMGYGLCDRSETALTPAVPVQPTSTPAASYVSRQSRHAVDHRGVNLKQRRAASRVVFPQQPTATTPVRWTPPTPAHTAADNHPAARLLRHIAYSSVCGVFSGADECESAGALRIPQQRAFHFDLPRLSFRFYLRSGIWFSRSHHTTTTITTANRDMWPCKAAGCFQTQTHAAGHSEP